MDVKREQMLIFKIISTKNTPLSPEIIGISFSFNILTIFAIRILKTKPKSHKMKRRYTLLIYVCLLCATLFFACKNEKTEQTNASGSNEPTLFTSLSPEKTHVDFQNNVNEGLNTNVLMYEYFYNGGGVAVGDINNDGLDDIYFTSNMQSNRLYLNKGNMQFQDITGAAGVAGRDGPWKTGTTMADVNGDGLLDIYVCYSGNLPPEKRANQLFINQGSNKFIDKAAEYGLNSFGTSTQAVDRKSVV